MPVQTLPVVLTPVPQADEYVSTIKGRRSATISPQVSGTVTQILAHSGEQVHQGQLLVVIDPTRQEADLASQEATAKQKLAVYQYNQAEVERQTRLFDAGIISKAARDQAIQAFENAKADYQAAEQLRIAQQRQLGFYHITAPFAGTVGDVPVHLGDYASPSTVLTTVDENKELEAYVYLPAERVSQVHIGTPVQIEDNSGNLIEKSSIYFISPQVDNSIQGILAKAPVHDPRLRTEQLVKARVIWSTRPVPTVPVLAVTRIGGQAFVYVAVPQDGKTLARQKAVSLGDTVGNDYAVLDGLKAGDQVIVSGMQFLVDGAPIMPLPSRPAHAQGQPSPAQPRG